MSEWQPAIFRAIHNYSGEDAERAIALNGTRYLVKPIQQSKVAVEEWRRIGCDAEKFFITQQGRAFCEHEILTD
jgi:hypothetical protein